MFKGSMVALVTPMFADGRIDTGSLNDLIEWHIAEKTAALVIAGTTGESATLESEEQFSLIKSTVKQARGRIPIIAGGGTNSTLRTVKRVQSAKEAGADACLIVTPYYNKPTQRGLFCHYETLVKAVDLPLIIYNVPARTGCDMQPETVISLSQFKNIIGIKEATGELKRCQQILKAVDREFAVWSGDDPSALALIQQGAQGVISVTANLAPKKMQRLCELAFSGEIEKAREIDKELAPLHRALFLESNPIPTKWALHYLGKVKEGIRLPLLFLDKQYQEEVKKALENAGVK